MAKNRVQIARDLSSVTTYDSSIETRPEDVGLKADAADKIWKAVQRMYRTGLHPGISLTIRRHGKVIMDRAIGHARGNSPGESGTEKLLMTPQTPICLYSASKSVTAMLAHKQVEKGLLKLDERVATYLPEYGVNGKEATTIQQLLAHRAGIPQLPVKNVDPMVLNDFETVVRLLCGAKPSSGPGSQQSYHAVTAGYIVGAVIQRVTGKSLQQVLHEELAEPLGCQYFRYGLDEADYDKVAFDASTGPKVPFPLSEIARRALYVKFEELADLANLPEFKESVVPAANIYSTADDSCRFYQMLLDDGKWGDKRLFSPETIAGAVKPASGIKFDRTLMTPIRFSPAFILGEKPVGMYGSNCPNAFGHLGFINIICWADPDRDISVALLNTGKSTAPGGIKALVSVQAAISRNLPRVAR